MALAISQLHGIRHVRCSAFISPIHRLRWDGFARGWSGNPEALEGSGYPILLGDLMIPNYNGEAHRVYREAVKEGAAARESA